MIPNVLRTLLFSFCLIVFFTADCTAGIEPYENFIKGKIHKNDSLNVKDEKFKNPLFSWADISNISVQNTLSLKILDESVIDRNFSCQVTLKVAYFSEPGQIEPTVIDSVKLNVNYLKEPGSVYKNLDVYEFKNGYYVKVTVLEINSPEYGAELPSVLQLGNQIFIDRQYAFKPFLRPGLNGEVSGSTKSKLNRVSSGSVTGNQLSLTWAGVQGAEEFDLEWVFIDEDSEWWAKALSMVYNGNLTNTELNAIFRNNATRITTSEHNYVISLLSNANYVAVRMRQVHYTLGIREEGEWFYKQENPDVFAIWPVVWHEPQLNWQYSIAYAEEGKRKEVVSYFDGTLRGRQTVTLGNSGTDVVDASNTVAVVQENIYDQFGRAAASILPAPVKESGTQTLHYFRQFNKGANGTYTFADLNSSNCAPHPNSLVTSSGASKYYSSGNEFKSLRPYNMYIPDAQGYPLSVTQYTLDNTGRIKLQGGVGSVFQPGITGENHTTRYFYGKPEQWELDRLFGNDVGTAAHYLKNMVVDPNGQISISYLNASGKTIATALSGLSPGNVDSLNSSTGEKIQKVTLLKPEQFSFDGTALKLKATTTYMASVTGVDTLHYSIEKLISRYPGGAFQPCSNCYYQLTISVTDDCGNSIPLPGASKIAIGSITPNCGDSGSLSDSFPVSFASIGTYHISFEFTLDKNVIERFTDDFIIEGQGAGVITKKKAYILNYFNSTDFGNCFADCKTAKTKLGSRADFIAMFKRKLTDLGEQADEYDSYIDGLYSSLSATVTILDQSCTSSAVSPCEIYRIQMLTDVSPGGQYALFDASGNPLETDINVLYKGFQQGLFNPLPSPGFNLQDLVENWKPEWADLFLPLHPEYCKLQFCYSNSVSESWDEQIRAANAASKLAPVASLFGSRLVDNAWLVAADPFFNSALGSAKRPAMINDLNYYSSQVLGLNSGVAPVKGLSQFVDYMLYCADPIATTAPNVSDRWTSCAPDISCRVEDREWQLYRDIYLDLKQKYIEEARKNSPECSNGCPIATPLTQPVISTNQNSCGSIINLGWAGLQISENQFSTEDNATRYTYSLVKGTPGDVLSNEGICSNYSEPTFYPCLTISLSGGVLRKFYNVWLLVCAETIGTSCQGDHGYLYSSGSYGQDQFYVYTNGAGQKDEYTIVQGYGGGAPPYTGYCNTFTTVDFYGCYTVYNSNGSVYNTYSNVWVYVCYNVSSGWPFSKNGNTVNRTATEKTSDLSIKEQIIKENNFVDIDKKADEIIIADGISRQVYSIVKPDSASLALGPKMLPPASKVNFTAYELKTDFIVQVGDRAYRRLKNVWVASYVKTGKISTHQKNTHQKSGLVVPLELNPCNNSDFYVTTQAYSWNPAVNVNVGYIDGIGCSNQAAIVDVYRNRGNSWTYIGQVGIPAGQTQANVTLYVQYDELPDPLDIYWACGTNPCSNGNPGSGGGSGGCSPLLFTKIPRFNTIDRTVLNVSDPLQVRNEVEGQLHDSIASSCERNAEVWMSKLSLGLAGKSPSDIALLRSKLIEMCSLAGDSIHPFGASSLPAGSILVKGIPCHNFGEVIKAALGSGTVFTDLLNPWLLDSPYPYSPVQQATEKVISNTNIDICSKLSALRPGGASDEQFFAHLQAEFGRAMNLTLPEFRILLKGCVQCKFLLAKDIILPVFLDQGTQGCISRSEYNAAINELSTYFSPLPNPGWSNYETIITNYLNFKWGFSFSYDQYKDFSDNSSRTKLCNEPPYTSVEEDPYACLKTAIEVAHGQATRDYLIYIADERDKFRKAYVSTCASAKADVALTTKEKIYHYTLYYYDLAGNLIRTVAPEGVKPLSVLEIALVDKARIFNPESCTYNGPTDNANVTTALQSLSTALAYNGSAAVEMWLYQMNGGGRQMIATTPDMKYMFQTCVNNNRLNVDVYSLRQDSPADVSIVLSNHITADISGLLPLGPWMHIVVQGNQLASGSLSLWINGKPYPAVAGAPSAGCGWTISGGVTPQMPMNLDCLKHLRLYPGRLMAAQEIKENAESGCFKIYDLANIYPYRFGVSGQDLSTQYLPIYPSHGLTTTYVYNSSNQVIRQQSPDAGTSRFWYDELSRLIISQNAKQALSGKYSYTDYDQLGRISEVGEKTVSNATLNSSEQQNTPGYLTDDFYRGFLASNRTADSSITQTFYDQVASGNGVQTGLGQDNIRKRVSASIYRDNRNTSEINASYYNYDLSGNVKTLYQQIAGLYQPLTGQGIKRLDYEYDLISGKVNFLAYQHNENDRFYYKYTYDAENRLRKAYSSVWANVDSYGIRSSLNETYQRLDAKYEYYLHGPLARTELGREEGQVQGLDYAYTLQGWLKGVNGSKLGVADIGADGTNNVSRDALAYSLGYYTGDYTPIGGLGYTAFNTSHVDALGDSTGNSLYNGNISSSTYGIAKVNNGNTAGYTYRYDQLNRLLKVRQRDLSSVIGTWNIGNSDDYKEDFSYDGNGNIKALTRNAAGTQAMDQLSYTYNKGNGKLLNNKLSVLYDAAGSNTPGELQGTTNYSYDALGNITQEKKGSALVAGFDWTVYGKISKVTKTTAAENITYSYDATGNRVSKTINLLSTWYVRDAQGNLLGLYDNASGGINWKEQQLYGSSRLGIWKPNFNLASDSARIKWSNTSLKFFELSNHLGNVMSVINDSRSFDGSAYSPTVINAQDYYAFGSVMPGRSYAITNNASYRYGFNGKENDNEVKGTGNQQDYGMRIYDPRVGRFLSVDPITKEYPELTPYQFASNRPIDGIDRDGLEYIESGAHANRIIREETARLAKIDPKLARSYVERGNKIGLMATGGMLFAGVVVATGPALALTGARYFITNPQTAMGAMGFTWGALVDEDMPGSFDDISRGGRQLLSSMEDGLKIPQGLKAQQFKEMSGEIMSGAGEISKDIVVQGSRAAGTARASSDIDIAIKVEAEQFEQLIKKAFGTPNKGSALERTMNHAIKTGKIQAGEAKLSSLRKKLEKMLNINVDVSVVKKGGAFDNGVQIPIKGAE